MKHASAIGAVLGLVCLLSIFAASVSGLVVLDHSVYLTYDNGTTVTLPAGTYTSIQKENNIWYVNGQVYPPAPTPTPAPTATPVPTVTPVPTPTPIPTYSPSMTPVPSPSPVPTYNPTIRPTETMNLYMRSDTYTTLGVTGYGLDSDYTNNATTISSTTSGIVNTTYGFRVFLVTSASNVAELTSGTPAAQIPLTSNFTGQLSSSWLCPTTDITLGYQALKVDLYETTNGGAAWTAKAGFITNVLITNRIALSTWTFSLDLNMTQTTATMPK